MSKSPTLPNPAFFILFCIQIVTDRQTLKQNSSSSYHASTCITFEIQRARPIFALLLFFFFYFYLLRFATIMFGSFSLPYEPRKKEDMGVEESDEM